MLRRAKRLKVLPRLAFLPAAGATVIRTQRLTLKCLTRPSAKPGKARRRPTPERERLVEPVVGSGSSLQAGSSTQPAEREGERFEEDRAPLDVVEPRAAVQRVRL